MALSFVDRVELENLLSNAKLEKQETVVVSVAVLESMLATSVEDSGTQTLPVA